MAIPSNPINARMLYTKKSPSFIVNHHQYTHTLQFCVCESYIWFGILHYLYLEAPVSTVFILHSMYVGYVFFHFCIFKNLAR